MNRSLLPSKNQSRYKNYIKEVKARFLYIVFSFVCVFLIAYDNALQLMHIFLLSFQNSATPRSADRQAASFDCAEYNLHNMYNQPLFEKRFIFTDLHEGFSSTLYVCLVMGLLCILPFIAYQFLSYFSPSWHRQERRRKSFAAVFLLFSWGGVLYVLHLYLIPGISSFLLTFQVTDTCLSIRAEAKIMEYLYWSSTLIFYTSFFVFLMFVGSLIAPRFLCIHQCAHRLTDRHHAQSMHMPQSVRYTRVLIGRRTLSDSRQFFFFFFFLFIAFFSPPEISSQIGVFLCSFVLFEIILWGLLIKFWMRRWGSATCASSL